MNGPKSGGAVVALVAALVAVTTVGCDKQPLATAPRAAESLDQVRGDTAGGVGAAATSREARQYARLLAAGYTCDDTEDCFEQCPEPAQDGGTTVCSCRRSGNGFWCDVREYGPGEQPGGLGCGGGGGDPGNGVRPTSSGLTFTKCRPAKVTLNCSATVTRGSDVTCDATFLNAMGNITYEWEFTPDGGGVQIWDHGFDLEDLPKVSAKTNSGTWSGTAAHGGVVVVSASDTSNTRVADTARFTVTDRGGWKITASFREGGKLTNYLGAVGAVLGQNTNAMRSAASTDILEGIGSASVSTVTSGPNQGYAYVKSQGYSVARFRWVNARLTPRGPKEVPDTAQGDTVNHWTYLSRRFYSPSKALDGTNAHEGYGHLGAKGHQGQIEAALTTSACGDAAGLVERVVGKTSDDAVDLVGAVEDAAVKAVTLASSHYYVHGNHSQSPIVLFAPGDSAGSIIFHTDPQGRKPGYPPLPGCLWSF